MKGLCGSYHDLIRVFFQLTEAGKGGTVWWALDKLYYTCTVYLCKWDSGSTV
jgi:hypothetical protein